LFPEREIFLRSGGAVRFVRISTRVQMAGAAAALALLGGWGALTVRMATSQAGIDAERAAIAARSQAVSKGEASVSRYRQSVDEVARDLEQRQRFLEDNMKSLTAGQAASAPVDAKVKDNPADAAAAKAEGKRISMLPGGQRLAAIQQRQRAMALTLTAVAQARGDAAERAIRAFGINPSTVTSGAQGGPYIPWRGQKDEITPELADMSAAIARLDVLQTTLAAMPSGKPTAAPMLTSSFGYRRDPFNGHAAFHAGLDFPGRYGQPILAAAAGRIAYVGQRQGYGNVVEVDHGHGIMTRYAHLSGFTGRVGQQVERGQQVGRMGSTGRSTGTHLHFEVRLHDQPINPRRFLEADPHVLEVQQAGKVRIAAAGSYGRNGR